MKLIRELRRRRVFRTAALYIVSSWVIVQVASLVLLALDIPDQASRCWFQSNHRCPELADYDAVKMARKHQRIAAWQVSTNDE